MAFFHKRYTIEKTQFASLINSDRKPMSNPLIAKGRGLHPNSLANIAGASRLYEANKKQRNMWITDLAWEELNKIAKELDISRPEILERIARGIYTINTNPSKETPNGTE